MYIFPITSIIFELLKNTNMHVTWLFCWLFVIVSLINFGGTRCNVVQKDTGHVKTESCARISRDWPIFKLHQMSSTRGRRIAALPIVINHCSKYCEECMEEMEACCLYCSWSNSLLYASDVKVSHYFDSCRCRKPGKTLLSDKDWAVFVGCLGTVLGICYFLKLTSARCMTTICLERTRRSRPRLLRRVDRRSCARPLRIPPVNPEPFTEADNIRLRAAGQLNSSVSPLLTEPSEMLTPTFTNTAPSPVHDLLSTPPIENDSPPSNYEAMRNEYNTSELTTYSSLASQ